jgi:gamma-glutamylcyclotransferase (GGCT)/AIG2-like uncharacterized protein YtfP
MTFYFAYGANMERAAMAQRCRTAVALGPAQLRGWRFVISCGGYASIASAPGEIVHGVLWRLCARDLAALNVFESLDSGLYRRMYVPVVRDGRCMRALVYVGRSDGKLRPRPGYLERVVAAAYDWNLPSRYIADLQRWAPSGYHGARPAETGEFT